VPAGTNKRRRKPADGAAGADDVGAVA
jgi:hypothetical protein